jgi:hypothetical protein
MKLLVYIIDIFQCINARNYFANKLAYIFCPSKDIPRKWVIGKDFFCNFRGDFHLIAGPTTIIKKYFIWSGCFNFFNEPLPSNCLEDRLIMRVVSLQEQTGYK